MVDPGITGKVLEIGERRDERGEERTAGTVKGPEVGQRRGERGE